MKTAKEKVKRIEKTTIMMKMTRKMLTERQKKEIDKQKKTKKMAEVTKVVERIMIMRESRLIIMINQNPKQTRKQT